MRARAPNEDWENQQEQRKLQSKQKTDDNPYDYSSKKETESRIRQPNL